jgi:threonylcarbamoyladenosine tRNA methylthiotransferase MtaB
LVEAPRRASCRHATRQEGQRVNRGPRTVGLMTVGCKLNQYETEGVAERLERRGFVVVPFDEIADVYVVNTCTVTGRSDYRSRQMLRRAARLNRDALVVATGCYAQREPERLAEMPEVDLVVGNSAKPDIARLVSESLVRPRGSSSRGSATDGDGRVMAAETAVEPLAGTTFEAFDISRFRGYTRAFIKIQDGCDQRCAYCAVPDARGPARSRAFDDVVAQAGLLASNGYREAVLTGVHIGAYEDSGGRRLPELLEALSCIDELVRLRLGSVEPRELTPALAEAVLTNVKIANHLHVPLESGSDSVLSRMRRGYTRDEYAEVVRSVTDRDRLCGLGTDVMVGFPGETDEDFADTVSLIESLPFTYLHVFAFSPRAGTAAVEMQDRVSAGEARRRSRFLREHAVRRSLEFRRGLVGRTLTVLVEQRERARPLSGLAGNYVRVTFEGGEELKNRFVDVAVTSADEAVTTGEPVPGSER